MMNILAIETSCDDTGIALVKVNGKKQPRFRILSNFISSQVEIHKKWGGIYPTLAKREHQNNLSIIFKKILRQISHKRIDLIAVTIGPGLEPCLWVGINFAKDLAKKMKSPVVPVNHIEAHILINFLNNKCILPAICLVVSGGHTQLILTKKIGKYQILGETRDDAAGECFDKTGRILSLGYPGGPAIAAASQKNTGNNCINLPRPMINQKNYDFSFSGLKTAVLYDFKNRPSRVRKSKKYIQAMAAEIQQAVIDVLIKKTLKAAKHHGVKSIILGGGVAANNELRKQFKKKIKKEIPYSTFYIPDSKYCTDNAVMTALTGYYHRQEKKKKNLEDIEAKAGLRLK